VTQHASTHNGGLHIEVITTEMKEAFSQCDHNLPWVQSPDIHPTKHSFLKN